MGDLRNRKLYIIVYSFLGQQIHSKLTALTDKRHETRPRYRENETISTIKVHSLENVT